MKQGLCYLLVFILSATGFRAAAQDIIEFLNGSELSGAVVDIHKADRVVEFEAVIAGRSQTDRYPYAKIHAVTWKGKRYVVTPMPAGVGTFVPDPAVSRTDAEVNQLIADYGGQPPAWLEETPLDYPDSLDLSWPMPAPQPWDNSKNMGQYIWDRINPNESRWGSGVKLMLHLLENHAKDAAYRKRVQESLASMYFRFFQDYPRAAYWWEKVGTAPGSPESVGLAECYWRMGNERMAQKMLDSRTLRLGAIKLLGDMGDDREALRLADAYASRVKEPHECLLLAGDVARKAGKYSQALDYYQKVIDLPAMNNGDYDERHRSRARSSMDSLKQFELLALKRVPEGTHVAQSLGYEGPIEVAVEVKSGRIGKVEVTKHKEKQFYSAITDTTRQIVKKQHVKNVETTSRATITSAAIINAAAKALADAQR